MINIPCGRTMCDNNTGNFEKICMLSIDYKLIKHAKSKKEMCPYLRKKVLELEKEFNKCLTDRIIERLEILYDESQDKLSDDFIYYDGWGDGVDMATRVVKEEGGMNEKV